MYRKIFFRSFFSGFLGLLFFLWWQGISFSNMVSFTYGFFVVIFDFFILARFSSSFIIKKSFQKSAAFAGMFLRYFIVFPLLYLGVRLAQNFMFAIISGAVWATFAFTITITTLLKERSGWSMEEHNSSHGR